MARHRNVRGMNYSDDYEGYDDVYGHSVEDDYSVSPSVAGFLYDRSRPAEMSAFLAEENNIAEEDEEMLEDAQMAELSDVNRAKLMSCVEEIQNIVGDGVALSVIQEIVMKNNFDLKKSLDAVLKLLSPKFEPAVKSEPPPAATPAPITTKIVIPTIKKDLKTDGKQLVTPEVPEKIVSRGTNVTKGFLPISSPQSGPSSRNHSRCASPDPDNAGRPQKSKSKLDISAAYAADRGSQKAHLHLVVIGHVDAGKSTLMGHLLHDLGQVNQRTMHKYEMETKKMGKQSFLYAWILDETGEERSRGITMDVGQSRFETENKIVYLLDAPGHRDFIPNMITGAAQADVAVLVVDATRGEFETGFESGGQTREHALLVRALGVSQLAVAVNKLDTVAYSKERFDEIVNKLGPFLKQAGFRDTDVTYVPCSGYTGDNLVKPSTQPQLTEWYDGPSLLQVIDNFKAPERAITKPLRMSIGDIYKATGSGQCVAGRIETGSLQAGDKVLIMPQHEMSVAKAVLIDDMPEQTAYAGDSVTVALPVTDLTNLAIGSVLCDASLPIPVVTEFEARIVVFNITVPIITGCPVVLHAHATSEQATVSSILALLHKNTGQIVKRRPRCLTKHSSALVRITVARPICLELYKDVKELGRIMLRVNGVSIAAGLVTKLV